MNTEIMVEKIDHVLDLLSRLEYRNGSGVFVVVTELLDLRKMVRGTAHKESLRVKGFRYE